MCFTQEDAFCGMRASKSLAQSLCYCPQTYRNSRSDTFGIIVLPFSVQMHGSAVQCSSFVLWATYAMGMSA